MITGEHLLEMAGALVRIKDNKIEVLSEPKVKSCPLRRLLYKHKQESKATIRKVLKLHIQELGMYTDKRVLELKERTISFGASEMLMDALNAGLLDAAVVVCDGAGTVITTQPEIVQAIGAHMTGLIKTSPIKSTQKGLLQRGCFLIDKKATIDQLKGVRLAIKKGLRKIGITATGKEISASSQIRKLCQGNDVVCAIFAVHNTGITGKETQILARNADIVWGCASKPVREIVGIKALLQIGISIPVFALTEIGKRIVLNRALHFEDSLLISRRKLPVIVHLSQPEPLV